MQNRTPSPAAEAARQLPTILTAVAGTVLAVLSWFVVPDDIIRTNLPQLTEKRLIGLSIFLLSLFIATALALLRTQRTVGAMPLRIRTVLPGHAYYAGRAILVLNSPLPEDDQILVLYVSQENAEVPLGLIRIDGHTTQGYAQAVLIAAFSNTPRELEEYLADKARWAAIFATPVIRESHLSRRAT